MALLELPFLYGNVKFTYSWSIEPIIQYLIQEYPPKQWRIEAERLATARITYTDYLHET